MKISRTFGLILLLTALALIISGCGGRAYGYSGWSGMTTGQDLVYIANSVHVYAVNPADGTEKWRFPDKADNNRNFYAAPVLTGDGQLLVGGYDKKLYSLDAATGVENTGAGKNWPFTGASDRYIAGPLVYQSTVYAPNADGHLYVLDTSGKLLRTYPEKGALGALWATPVLDEKTGYLFLASMDHNLYAIDYKTGKLAWKKDLGGSIVGSPALSPDGKLFIGTFASKFYALDAQSGNFIWPAPVDLNKAWAWDGPAVDQEKLYFGDTNGNFYILQTSDGKILKQNHPGGPIVSTPALTQDMAFFGTDNGSIYAVDHDGNPQWNVSIGTCNIYTSPLVLKDANNAVSLILVAPTDFKDGLLVALNPDHTTKWTFNPKK